MSGIFSIFKEKKQKAYKKQKRKFSAFGSNQQFIFSL